MPVFGMMWRCVGPGTTQPHLNPITSLFITVQWPSDCPGIEEALGWRCVAFAWHPGICILTSRLGFDQKSWYLTLKMLEDVWRCLKAAFDLLIVYDCMTVWCCCIGSSSVGIVWAAALCVPRPLLSGIKAIQGGASGDVREVKEANQLAEMDTAKSHKMKKDEVAIRTKGTSEKTRTLCTESRAPDRSIYTIFENLRSCRTLSLEVVDPKPDVCCRPSCVWSCFDFYPNDRCGLVTQFCHKNW